MKSKNVNDSTNLDKSVNDKLVVSELARNATVTCGDSKSKEKIKTSFAQIIVRKIKEKPYLKFYILTAKTSVSTLDLAHFILNMFFSG